MNRSTDMASPDLIAFAGAIAAGDIDVVDLTHTLSPEFPTIVMPPELGQCAPFRMEEVSRYDERGPAWYWNNISMGEHTGTHFDAPVHWISGKDLPHNSVDTIPPANFIAPAAVIDISRQSAANPDYELTVADLTVDETGDSERTKRDRADRRPRFDQHRGALRDHEETRRAVRRRRITYATRVTRNVSCLDLSHAPSNIQLQRPPVPDGTP
jgi:kynurenine formamidase